MERFARNEHLGDWNDDIEALLSAAEAAQEVGGFDPTYTYAQVKWPDREAEFRSVHAVRERLRHGPHPTEMVLSVAADNQHLASTARVAIHVGGTFRTSLWIHGNGADWERSLRAYDAAKAALMRDAVKQFEAEVPDPVPPHAEIAEYVPRPSFLAGARAWSNDNQGVLAALGLFLAVAAIVVAFIVA